jgi:hypothetical protein
LGVRVDLAAALGNTVARMALQRSARLAAEAEAKTEAEAVVAAEAAAVAAAEAAVEAAAEAAAAAAAKANVSVHLLVERWGSCECPTTDCSTNRMVCAKLEQSCCEEGLAAVQQQTHCCMHHVRACLEVTAAYAPWRGFVC